MTATRDLEHRIADYCASEAPQRAPAWVLEMALATIELTRQRRALIRAPWRFQIMNRNARVAIATVVVIATGAVGVWYVAPRMPPGEVVSSSRGPSTLFAASPPPAASPSALPAEVSPVARVDLATPPSERLVWTRARLDQDWPAPVRLEPAGGGTIVTMVLADDATWDSNRAIWEPFEHRDPIGDVSGESVAWVDITKVKLGAVAAYALELADDVPRPQADPADRWIAFGIVQDTNGDGAADARIGIDNLPVSEHRAWYTDIASGETKSAVGPPYGWVGTAQGGGGAGRVGLDTYYPGEGAESGSRATLRYSFTFEELTRRRAYPFYAWASMIEGGRVVATDYAPDAGWLQEGVQPEVRLDGPIWTSESELSGDGRIYSLVQELAITADGKLSFDAGCTKGEGNVTVETDKLRVSDLILTEDACSAKMAEVDAKTMAVLGAGEMNYGLTRGVLQLWAGEDAIQFEADFGP